MTVQELLNGVVYTGTLAGAIVAIFGLLHFALVRPMRSFLRKEIVGSLVDIKDAVELNTTMTESLEHKLEAHIANGGHVHPELVCPDGHLLLRRHPPPRGAGDSGAVGHLGG